MLAASEELVKAGCWSAGKGSARPRLGARMTVGKEGKMSIKDGPFTESIGMMAGFSILQVK